MPVRRPLFKLLLLSILASPLAAIADPVYSMTFLPQNVVQAVGIDNTGRIALTFQDPAIAEAGLWSGGNVITGLGFLGTGRLSVAFGISNNGIVAGYSEISPGPNFGPHAYVYANGTMNDLGTLGGSRSLAKAVNDSGQAAGISDTADGFSHAFRYTGGVMHDLGTLGGPGAEANAINNSGVVVGSSGTTDAQTHAYMTGDHGLIDLGTLPGGTFSVGSAINDAGLIAGLSNGTGFEDSPHAFLYQNGVMTDISTFAGPTTVQDINNLGQVVGRAGSTAYLFTNGQMVDLNSLVDPALGWRVVDAVGINDSQQIAAAVFKEGVGSRFVRLDLIPAVPEPGTYAMFLAGLVLFGSRRRRSCRACISSIRGASMH